MPLSDIVGKRVKLTRKGNRFTGLCPFHSEKTPSFSVVDDQGFYHCFGCGVHGDAISFLRETDGLDFMEAVERLASMAGLTVPRSAPEDPQRTRQRKAALDILEETARYFQAGLKRDDGRVAARYLHGRGLDAGAVGSYRLGYAPRGGLRAALAARGFTDEDMLAAGVVRRSDRDGELFDYFRDRVMFPIENQQGRVIAFGARALGDAQPKYLNSGEGPTFSKKTILYGLVQAREGLRRKLPLVVGEGYMDVIACHRAGFTGAVAPMGTALTEEQITHLGNCMTSRCSVSTAMPPGSAPRNARLKGCCRCCSRASRRGWPCCRKARTRTTSAEGGGTAAEGDQYGKLADRQPVDQLCRRA